MFFIFYEHVFLVRGLNKYMIHDFNKKKLYEVSLEIGDILTMLTRGQSTQEIAWIFNISSQDLEEHLRNFQERSIGFLSDHFIRNEESIWEFLKIKEKINKKLIDFAWCELTSRCNLECIHCSCSGSPLTTHANDFKVNFFDVVKQIRDLGCDKIQFTGGEPMLRKQLLIDLIKYSSSLGFSYREIYSNLNLLDDDLLRIITEYQLNIATSIYGHNAKIHDAVTTVQGSFDKTINSLRKLQQANINIRVGIILMDINLPYKRDILKFVKSMEISNVKVDIVRNAGRGCALFDTETKSAKINSNSGFGNLSLKEDFFWRSHLAHNCFSNHICINEDGNVFPCVMLRESLGNLENDSLYNIIVKDESQKLRNLTKDKVDKCSLCELRYVCFDCRIDRKDQSFLSQSLCSRYF